MKTTFTIVFIIQFTAVLSAQIVNTFAGMVDSIGSADGIGIGATFNNPHGIAISRQGNIYICDRFNHTIRKISPTGHVSTLAGTPGVLGDEDGQGSEAKFYEPWGLCVDHQENVFVADSRNNKIRKISPDGLVSTFAGTGNFGTTDGLLTNSTFGLPVGIESDGNGNFYVADHDSHLIRKISSNGQVTTLAGAAYVTGDVDGQGSNARFNKPYGLTLDLDGNIIVADEWNHKIRKITPDGLVTTIAGLGIPGGDNGSDTFAKFNYPWDVAVDSSGFIYVADGLNHVVRKITPDGNNEVSTYVGTIGLSGHLDTLATEARFNGITGLAISPLTRELLVGDAFNQVVRKISDLDQGVHIIAEEEAAAFCPNESLIFNVYPNVFDQYNFYVDNSIVGTSSFPYFDAIGLSPGSHTIKVVSVLDSIQIVSEETSFNIFEIEQATIDTIGSTTFFEGDSVILVASFGQSYFWSSGADTPLLTVRESGYYSVEVTDANDCSSFSSQVNVNVIPDPEEILISSDGSETICEGEILYLTANQTENVQWLKDGWPIPGETGERFQVLESGVYQAQYMDVSGAVVISEVLEILVLPGLELEFEADKNVVKQNESIQFSILNNDLISVEWNFGDSLNIGSTSMEPIHSYPNIGIYDVSLFGIDDRGCSNTLTLSNFIRVFSESDTEPRDDVFVASGFTPNGDGQNDFVMVRGTDIDRMHFKVFNDQGQLMFESNNQSLGWDGNSNNKKAPIGNYIYQLNYTDLLGVDKKITGRIALLK